MKQKINNFTLLELLIVTVVCLILLAISAPAFLSMSKGQSVDIAARNFGSELKALRIYAITNRQSVALVLPTTQTNIPPEYLYKSYRPCIVKNITDNSCDFDEWLESEKWEFLPTGTAILDIDNSPGHTGTGPGSFLSAGGANGIQNVDLESIGGSSNTNGLRALIYNERGVPRLIDANKNITVGDEALLLNNVSSVNNTIDIFINGFTGRVTYNNN